MLSTGWECFLQGWNAFASVGIPLYSVGILAIVLECSLQSRSAFYSVGMLSAELECFGQSWRTFSRVGKALDMLK
jgi:hypothetical protein